METSAATVESTEYLQSQVQRLNAVLKHYQQKNPQENSQPQDLSFASAPGVEERSLLSPLLSEYDRIISEMNQKILSYQAEAQVLASRVEQVVEENNRLYDELKQNTEMALQAASAGSQVSSVASESLHKQILLLNKERNNYIELLKQTNTELEHAKQSEHDKSRELIRCKTELAAMQRSYQSIQHSSNKLQGLHSRTESEKQHCLITVQQLETEVQSLEKQLQQCHSELKKSTQRNDELMQILEETNGQLKLKTAEQEVLTEHEGSLDERVHELFKAKSELEAKALALQRECAHLREHRTVMEAQVSKLKAKVDVLQQRECEAVSHVKESMAMVESALMEKEQAEVREQQCVVELKRLQKSLSTSLEEAESRAKQEVEALREEYNHNIDKMAVEIHTAEQEKFEKQAQLEQAQRDKKALEKELQASQAQHPLEQGQVREILQELRSKLITAERGRDESLGRVKSLELSKQKLESRFMEQQKENSEILEELQGVRKERKNDGQALRSEISKLTDQCRELQAQLEETRQLVKTTEQKYERKHAILAEQQKVREKGLIAKAYAAEEAHQRITLELRELISAQQCISIKWKEEARSITDKFERTVTALEEGASLHRRRNEELIVQVNHSQLSNRKLVSRINELETEVGTLRSQLQQVEEVSDQASARLAILLSREKELLKEKRQLQHQIDRARIQVARNLGISSNVGNTTVMAELASGPLHNTSVIGYSTIYPSRGDRSVCNNGSGKPQLHSTLLKSHAEASGKVSSWSKTSAPKHSHSKHGRSHSHSKKAHSVVPSSPDQSLDSDLSHKDLSESLSFTKQPNTADEPL